MIHPQIFPINVLALITVHGVSSLQLNNAKSITDEGHVVYWCKYGVATTEIQSGVIYLLHNNGACFRLKRASPIDYVPSQMECLTTSCDKDYKLSLIEMCTGILLRAATPDEHIPDVHKLNTVAARMLQQVKNSKENVWRIC